MSVVCNADASFAEKLAAKEVRRYVYVRTGKLLPIVGALKTSSGDGSIVIGTKDGSTVRALLSDDKLKAAVDGLAPEQYLLKTFQNNGQPILLIAGGDAVGTLYGAYRFAEHLGVRFYLDGDLIPDEQIPLTLPKLNDIGKPLFATRGVLPFHDFPEGPDLWNLDDYRAVLAQLAKLRMNFIGLHTYLECGWGSEPTVWIGLPNDVAADGSVRFSPIANYFNTARTASNHAAKKTGDFGFGAAQLFVDDSFGPSVMQGLMPWGKTPDERNELYRRTGNLLRNVFESAHKLGMKTCVGTEMPLGQYTPNDLKEHLKQQGKDVNNPEVLRDLYRGIFQWAMKAYPIDYYWLWTPECWTWDVVKQPQIDAVVGDFRAALAAAKDVHAPFEIATCGWVLGPPQNPSLFDSVLPKDVVMGCINRVLGRTPIDPAFATIKGRQKWAIPWLEDDLSMSTPEMWVGRMRKDAADAKKYGCTGLLGIHWRTRDTGPELAALAAAAWDQQGWRNLGESAKVVDSTVEVIGGQIASFNSPIADTTDGPLYQNVRYDMSAYRFHVPNGKYTVKLQFCEPVYTEPNKRVFGVTVQGNTVIDKLDIFAKVGRNRALDYSFRAINVTNGILEIGFLKDQTSQLMKEAAVSTNYKEFPCIAALVVEGPNFIRKINCGGGAHRDYQADPVDDSSQRYAATGDFYLDWASHQFGPKAAKPVAAILQRIDGHLPEPAPVCPGGIQIDGRPWAEAEKAYVFVEELANVRPKIAGAANLQRFDYWLNSLRYLKATGRVACRLSELDRAMDAVNHEPDAAKKLQLVQTQALPLRIRLVNDWGQMVTLLLETVGNWGEIGTVLTHEMFDMQGSQFLNRHDKAIEKILGKPLPPAAQPWSEYRGTERFFLPTVRTSLQSNEDLALRLMLLSNKPPKSVSLYWRPMGEGKFTSVPFQHQARGVYTVVLSADSIGSVDLEYYVKVETGEGRTLYDPMGAPTKTHTVVVTP